MNRRSFIGSFFAAFATATLLPKLPASVVKPDVYAIDFAIEENIGYGIINPAAMADAYAAIFAHDMAPDYMFMHPLDYKKLNPEGYAEMVRLQEMNDGRDEEDVLATTNDDHRYRPHFN